ncbi:hypothetical protein TPHA_0G01490 [Tetrapisispora phaffii CBS 4417]|uniref:N-acetyltransferase domain-containing protein n=1 Tax=Tetrapisispora phaffii (strain ATCC 24235 / CBS 4417 / NBRC 1672 / NRRL Y-8282 / UCD 70-5) TaxID=1071381 RepID=G8BVQ8_TETPH|nr:hypothetical protein TPHA_0G01490 [Tetrapisispora phaffii CBS 4417]CCE63986.1 hypothetical protein TPHA_0G01490 [Tetrapisispora phaffii CBS 4417]
MSSLKCNTLVSMLKLGTVNEKNLGVLEVLVKHTLPITYPTSFYKEICTSESKVFFSKITYFRDMPVGAIKARLIPNKKNSILSSGIYIELIVVLKNYRKKGIASTMLMFIEEQAKKHYQHDIYVHVSINNIHAIEWYTKQGFKLDSTPLKNYYQDLDESSKDAYVMKKVI